MLCACHEICTTGSRGPAATTLPPGPPQDAAHCACYEICTPGSPSAVPATKSALRGSRCHEVLRLPQNRRSRFTKCCACHEICATGSRGPAATTRPPGPPEGSAHCACHKTYTPGSPSAVPETKSAQQAAAGQRRPRVHPVLLKALCTAPATKSALQVHQVLRLPRNLHLSTAPATKSARKMSGK